MQNDKSYNCEITAYSGNDQSETIAVGQVTPTSQAETNTTFEVFVDGDVEAPLGIEALLHLTKP